MKLSLKKTNLYLGWRSHTLLNKHLCGNWKNLLKGIEYLLLIRLHVSTYELTGEIKGVWEDTIDWLVDCIDEGYVWADKPIKFPNDELNVNCGV